MRFAIVLLAAASLVSTAKAYWLGNIPREKQNTPLAGLQHIVLTALKIGGSPLLLEPTTPCSAMSETMVQGVCEHLPESVGICLTRKHHRRWGR